MKVHDNKGKKIRQSNKTSSIASKYREKELQGQ